MGEIWINLPAINLCTFPVTVVADGVGGGEVVNPLRAGDGGGRGNINAVVIRAEKNRELSVK